MPLALVRRQFDLLQLGGEKEEVPPALELAPGEEEGEKAYTFNCLSHLPGVIFEHLAQ